MYDGKFITPEIPSALKGRIGYESNGWLLFVACNEGIDLAEKVKAEYDRMLMESGSGFANVPFINDSVEGKMIVKRVSDTETIPRLPDNVAGAHAVVFQSVHELRSGNTVNDNLMQLLQVIWTLKANRAKTVTAVMPYSPYSRQEKPTHFKREAALSKFVADMLVTAGVNNILAYHLHTETIRGFYEPKVVIVPLNGLDLFIDIGRKLGFHHSEDVVCVSTDAGGAKQTIYLASALDVDYAIGNKFRPAQESAQILGITGNLAGKRAALISDDETVSGTSLVNAARELHLHHGIAEIYMLVSHNKIRAESIAKLVEAHEKYGLVELHVTDSIPQTDYVLGLNSLIRVHSLAERFARAINRLHYDLSVSELFQNAHDEPL